MEHFFAERYDYRRQWLACIRTLVGQTTATCRARLPTRVIRTIASVVDSPAGALFLRDGGIGPVRLGRFVEHAGDVIRDAGGPSRSPGRARGRRVDRTA